MSLNVKDFASGLLFIAIGLFFALDAGLKLKIGEAMSMGPGYFPLVLGLVLTAIGVGISFTAIGKPADMIGQVSWRGVILVLGSIVFFGATARGLGFAPSLAIAVLMAARSSERLGWIGSIALATIFTICSVAIFIYALGLPYPLVGPWLRG